MKHVSGRLALTAMLSTGLLGWAVLSPLSAQDKSKPAAKVATKANDAKTGDAKTGDAKTGDAKADDKKPEAIKLPEKAYSTGYTGSYEELIGYINAQLREGWVANEVQPSDVAEDGEWLRRVHLDIVGHIPDFETTEKFLADKDKAKRSKMIDQLLEDPAYVRNMVTIWTNLLIGRATPRDINRESLQKFLRDSFGKNRAWSEIVSDLLTAEGTNEMGNGQTNFLLSHLNDGQVPATAISAKLFLGVQVQCTQCHNHPFNEWKQDQFWEFNSFFKQSDREEVRKYNEQTGRMDVDHLILRRQEAEPGVFFETRNALMKVAYPRYNGVDVAPEGDRRKELAKLVITGDKTQVSDAMVNRMWGHFFGYGFTKPVDDMGPHNAPSHPALLDRLSTEFVKSGYDVKQLIRWIANSEAYNLTSKFNAKNQKDNPPAGEPQLFSHMYVKSMQVEQLYDSLVIASNAEKAGNNLEQASGQRQRWLQQFVQAFGTDENDEVTTFDGTIPQALMMMNGELVQKALSASPGTTLNTVLTSKGNDALKIRRLYVATLCRNPSRGEIAAAQRILSKAKSPLEAYQDLYWALLNSNEFIFNF